MVFCRRGWLVGLGATLGLLSASPLVALDWRVLSESTDGQRLRVEVRVPAPQRLSIEIEGRRFTRFDLPGVRPVGSPGAPELLEASRLVALPEGAQASLQLLELDLRDAGPVPIVPRPFPLVGYGPGGSPKDPSTGFAEEALTYDAEAYLSDGVRREAVRLGESGRLRHLHVVSVDVAPILYDPATQQAQVVQRLVFEISMQRGREKGDWGDALQARRVTPVAWERVYDHTVLNARSAADWLRTPARQERLGKPLDSGLLRPGLLNEEEWKLRVGATGPLRVLATTLLAAGFPDGTPVERLRLVLKRFDAAAPLEPRILEIPLHMEDDGDGLFRSGDSFLFYAEHPRDDSTAGERAARYSFTNVYWLSITDTGLPPRMPLRPFAPGGATPGPASFDQDIVYEEDRAINQWVYGDNEELYFLLDLIRLGDEARWSVAVPGRAPGADLEVCVDTQQDWLQRAFTVQLRLASGRRLPLGSSAGVVPPTSIPPPRTVLCGQVAAADMEPGDVTVVLQAQPVNNGFEDTTPFVDNIRLRYTAQYRATGDRIRCRSGGATGATAFAIAGFSGAPLYAFDVTERKSPALFDLTGALVGGTLTLTDDVPPGVTRSYEVLPRSGVPTLSGDRITRAGSDPILDELATLPLGAYDVLVVAHDDFAQEAKLLEWKAFRESQGFRVRIVSTSTAYDAFNGGLLHYDPIYALVRAAYENWGIGFVLLVGDGSEDAAGLLPTSGPNFVPDALRYFPVQASSGGGLEYRNDLHERYYAKMDGDVYPDLLIGRLPVSNAQELANVVNKIVLYENPAEGDDSRWRKRVLLFSDDEWVRRQATSGIVHRRGCSEWNFFYSIRRCCDIVEGAWPGDLQCVPFYLHEFSNRLVEDSPVGQNIPEHAPWPIDSVAARCFDPEYLAEHRGPLEFIFYEGDVARALVDSVGSGVLMFALQSHANRAVVTDEQVLRRRSDPAMPFQPDFRNHGKPFIFFGLGCHLNEFGVPGENAGAVGDALGELYLTVPERAAVASYASTGFEYLQANNRFHENMWRTIFEKRYFRTLGGGFVNSDTLEADWELATLLQISEISNGDRDIIDRYALFGDPLMRLDAGLPRFRVVDLENAVLFEDGRIVVRDVSTPVRFSLAVSDEQGIDSLWVEKRFLDGRHESVPDVVATASIDTAQQVTAKRGYLLDFSLLFDTCDFALVVGALDRAGRLSEFVARAQPEQNLAANGLIVTSGSQVDRRTNFRYTLEDCVPDSSLELSVLLDGQPLDISLSADSLYVTWLADFAWDVPPGPHRLSFLRQGLEIYQVDLVVGGDFGMHDVIAFPNPFALKTHFFFNLDAEIASGFLRIMDLNGRTVRQFDLRDPGILQALLSEPPAGLGTTMAMNFVEWDGTDSAGGQVANGVYFYELRLADASGREVRKRDKVVVMR